MELNIPESKKDIFIKSTMWNSIIDTFKTEKNIDITKYLISIKIQGNTLLLKSNKPLFNSEALLLDDKIKILFSKRIKKMWIIFEKYEIKYI